MRKIQALITCMCLAVLTASAWTESMQRPGLWEMTSTTVWQKSPMPSDMTMPADGSSPFGGSARTSQVCLTKEMIDKYGTPPPQSRNNQCQMSNIVKKAKGMTGDWVCSGAMAGKGTVEATFTDADHSTSKVHFMGSMQMGPNAAPIEYTIESRSVYKGADCGSVKPITVPKE